MLKFLFILFVFSFMFCKDKEQPKLEEIDNPTQNICILNICCKGINNV